MNGSSAAFLDRDGVINRDTGYVSTVEAFEFLPGAIGGMRTLTALGYRIVIVTNQSGIARGLYDTVDFIGVMKHMTDALQREGIKIALAAYCPHHPDFTGPCRCRKPAPGMIIDGAARLNIDLNQSILIGDAASDIAAGRAAGVERCYLIAETMHDQASGADAIFSSLEACADALALERLRAAQ